jgi:hypothetical protein
MRKEIYGESEPAGKADIDASGKTEAVTKRHGKRGSCSPFTREG